ncbi:MAG: glutaredoxin domain-containing protein [Bacteroidales bacterium]
MNKENDIVSQDTFIIYGGEGCSNCKQVVQLLNQKNKQFVYKSFGKDYELQELTDLGVTSRSIPQVFVTTEGNVLKHIGGLMETVKFLKNN